VNIVAEYLSVMRRMPFAAAQELHSKFGIPWVSITATCPAPTLARFTDRNQLFYEPADDGRAVWVLPACCVDPLQPEEIEAVDPLDVVATGPIVDLVALHPGRRNRFARRTGGAVVLGAVEPQLLGPDRVPVWSDVGDWLRGSCRGIVLLTSDCHQKDRILRRLTSIEVQQPDEVRDWIALPAYPPGLPPAVFPMRGAA
jgi:hypothetical protein